MDDRISGWVHGWTDDGRLAGGLGGRLKTEEAPLFPLPTTCLRLLSLASSGALKEGFAAGPWERRGGEQLGKEGEWRGGGGPWRRRRGAADARPPGEPGAGSGSGG